MKKIVLVVVLVALFGTAMVVNAQQDPWALWLVDTWCGVGVNWGLDPTITVEVWDDLGHHYSETYHDARELGWRTTYFPQEMGPVVHVFVTALTPDGQTLTASGDFDNECFEAPPTETPTQTPEPTTETPTLVPPTATATPELTGTPVPPPAETPVETPSAPVSLEQQESPQGEVQSEPPMPTQTPCPTCVGISCEAFIATSAIQIDLGMGLLFVSIVPFEGAEDAQNGYWITYRGYDDRPEMGGISVAPYQECVLSCAPDWAYRQTSQGMEYFVGLGSVREWTSLLIQQVEGLSPAQADAKALRLFQEFYNRPDMTTRYGWFRDDLS